MIVCGSSPIQTGFWSLYCQLCGGQWASSCVWGWEITRCSQAHLDAQPNTSPASDVQPHGDSAESMSRAVWSQPGRELDLVPCCALVFSEDVLGALVWPSMKSQYGPSYRPQLLRQLHAAVAVRFLVPVVAWTMWRHKPTISCRVWLAFIDFEFLSQLTDIRRSTRVALIDRSLLHCMDIRVRASGLAWWSHVLKRGTRVWFLQWSGLTLLCLPGKVCVRLLEQVDHPHILDDALFIPAGSTGPTLYPHNVRRFGSLMSLVVSCYGCLVGGALGGPSVRPVVTSYSGICRNWQ